MKFAASLTGLIDNFLNDPIEGADNETPIMTLLIQFMDVDITGPTCEHIQIASQLASIFGTESELAVPVLETILEYDVGCYDSQSVFDTLYEYQNKA